jgi:hypothetical protein
MLNTSVWAEDESAVASRNGSGSTNNDATPCGSDSATLDKIMFIQFLKE